MNELKYYVYGYIRLDTNSYFYIGKGCGNRLYELNYSRNNHFKNIVNTHNVCVEILKANLTEDEAYFEERNIIEELVFEEGYSLSVKGMKRFNGQHLVNKSWGGDGNIGYEQSDFAKESLRKRMTGRIVSEETRRKLSEINKGEKHPKYGTTHSAETRKKISEAQIGKKYSEETIRRLRESHLGQISPNRKAIRCIELDLYFDSVDSAVKYMKKIYDIGCCKANAVCNGKRPFAGTLSDGTKLHWEWVKGKNYTPATTEYENAIINNSEATV